MTSLYLVSLNSTTKVSRDITTDSIVIFRSTELNLSSSSRTALNLIAQNNNIVLHIGFRRDQDAIVFNAHNSSGWLHEERISFGDRLKGQNHSITVTDHGDRYQIAFNGATGHYFAKQINSAATSLQYTVDAGHQSLFSNPVAVETYAHLSDLVSGLK